MLIQKIIYLIFINMILKIIIYIRYSQTFLGRGGFGIVKLVKHKISGD